MTGTPDEAFTALYMYGIIPSVGIDGQPLAAGARGLNGAPVHVVAYRDVGVLVHACAPIPYQGDVAAIHAWVLAQHEVVRATHADAGTILPIRFNSIVAATDDRTADDVLVAWLERCHDELAARLAELRDRVELGIQILSGRTSVDPSTSLGAVPALSVSRGRAYFQDQLAARQDKERLRASEALTTRAVFDEVAARSEAIVVNPKRPERLGSSGSGAMPVGGNMLLDVAVLAHPDQVGEIGQYLGELAATPGLTVRFTGPWAPYAFAGAFDMPLLISATSDPTIDDPTIDEGVRTDV